MHEAEAANFVQSLVREGAFELWHCLLGHLNVKGVHILQNIVIGMIIGKHFCPIFSLFCETCIEGKQHRVVLPNEGGRRATKPLKIVYFYVYFVGVEVIL